MAFPTIQTSDTQSGTVVANTNPWTLTYPTNLVSGDLVMMAVGIDGAPGFTLPAGWNTDRLNGTAVSLLLGLKISDGTETGSFSLSLGASEQGGWRVFRVTGWFGSGLPASANGAASHGDGASWGLGTTGSTANPDPSSLDPSNWATEDTLWFAFCAADTSRTISVYPLADNNTADVSGGAGGATLGVCTLNDAVSSKDPGTFTISAADDWCAMTVAVRPAAAATPVSYPFPSRPAPLRNL